MKLYEEIMAVFPEIDLQPEANLFSNQKNIYDYILSAAYYKGLAGYCKLKSPKRILEIGTCTGASAVCMAKYSSNILTLDVVDANINFAALATKNILFQKVTPQEVLEFNFSDFDFIFVDIDHTGDTEKLLHQLFKAQYHGIVFWDDVQMNPAMKSFWDTVDCPKIVTNWHFTGFGLVEY